MFRRTATLVFGVLLAVTVAELACQSPWPRDTLQVARPPAPSCMAETPRFGKNSVGPLRAGQTVQEILRHCPRLAFGWDWGDEGIPEPVADVRLGRMKVTIAFRDTLRTSVATRIWSEDSSARTAEGIGPGILLSRAIDAYGVPTLYAVECVLWAEFPKAKGLGWRLRTGLGDCVRLNDFDGTQKADSLPGSTQIHTIIQVGGVR